MPRFRGRNRGMRIAPILRFGWLLVVMTPACGGKSSALGGDAAGGQGGGGNPDAGPEASNDGATDKGTGDGGSMATCLPALVPAPFAGDDTCPAPKPGIADTFDKVL